MNDEFRFLVIATSLRWIGLDHLSFKFRGTEVDWIEVCALFVDICNFAGVEVHWILFEMLVQVSRVGKPLLLGCRWLPCFWSHYFSHVGTASSDSFDCLLQVLQLSLLVHIRTFLLLC